MDKDKFFELVYANIDLKVAEIIKDKEPKEKYLTYPEFKGLTARVEGIFSKCCGEVPGEVAAACALAAAVIAPSVSQKVKLFKTVLGISGISTGLGLIIGALATALGWGTATILAVKAIFVSTAIWPPIGMGVGGAALVGIAVYSMVSSDDPAVASEKAVTALRKSIEDCKYVILERYGEKIQAAEINKESK
ncbi:MAG: hypothetical protein ACOYOS_14750 [Syntrophales bacterium]